MIQTVAATAFTWKCPVCHLITETLYSALTIGIEDAVNILQMPVCVCGTQTHYSLPYQRASMAQLALAEVFSLAKGTASYYGAYTSADVDAILGARVTLSDYVTLPADISGKGGQVHYQAMQRAFNGAQIADIIKTGHLIYGTDAYVRSIIALVAAGDDTTRRRLLGNHGLKY